MKLGRQGIHSIHPLHEAMLDEFCDKASDSLIEDEVQLIITVQLGFLTANSILRGLLKGAFTKADVVTLNYRGKRFLVTKDSPILKDIGG